MKGFANNIQVAIASIDAGCWTEIFACSLIQGYALTPDVDAFGEGVFPTAERALRLTKSKVLDGNAPTLY